MERMGKKGTPRVEEMNGIKEFMEMIESLERIPQKKEDGRGSHTSELFGRILERKTGSLWICLQVIKKNKGLR